MSCGIGLRHSSDLALLGPWWRAVATAPIRPLAWEFPHAVAVALENTKRQKDKKKKKKKKPQKQNKNKNKNPVFTEDEAESNPYKEKKWD